ncbi:MAG TPA: hypothetical protein VN646_04705 [Candidatus Acidoferrum sp.]|jgi:hypothetical protein|nr:hypothetical protein [Candidatus Acidoferrum sp.]
MVLALRGCPGTSDMLKIVTIEPPAGGATLRGLGVQGVPLLHCSAFVAEQLKVQA